MRVLNFRTLSSLLTFTVLLFFGCEDFGPEAERDQFSFIETIDPQTDQQLSKLLGDLYNNNQNPAGRSLSTDFGEINLSEALKLNDTINNRTRYTLTLNKTYDSLIFENLIISVRENGVFQYILQYKPDTAWLFQKPNKLDLRTYSGIVRQFDINRNFVDEIRLEHGVKVESYTSGGRTKACCTWEVWTSETTGYSYLLIDCEDGSSFMVNMMRVNCGGGSGDAGGTPGGGNSGGYSGGDGGGYTGGGSTGGGYSGGGDYYTGGSGNTSSGGYVGDPIGISIPPDYQDEIILIERPKIIEQQLIDLLEVDPFVLVEIPCNQIPKWQILAQNEASQDIKDKINDLQSSNTNWFDDWAIQSLNGANGTIVNMDYFAVTVSTLPNNPSTGSPFTPEGLLDYFRRNINDFVEGSTFSPYCETPTLCTQETELWNSDDPTGAIIYIDIPVDDGVVICSEYTSSYWYFMTLVAPGAGNHPVSGTRQFGFEANENGSYDFFVRGVDRFDSNIMENAAYMRFGGNPFKGADDLWKSFQNGLRNFINSNAGSSAAQKPVTYRPDWKKIQDVLEGRRQINDIGCK